MSEKFKGKYRSETTRLKGKDYAAPGKYFVTINTKNREHFFGNIVYPSHGADIQYSEIGMIANTCCLEIPNHFSNVKLDEYVIMPDHIHMIIEIVDCDIIDNNFQSNDVIDTTIVGNSIVVGNPIVGVDPIVGVVDPPHGTDLRKTPQLPQPTKTNHATTTIRNPYHFPEWHPGTLGVIVNQFKSSVTRIVRKQFPNTNFAWQPLFHDRIIRDDEYSRIKLYIRNNILNWKIKSNQIYENPKCNNTRK